MRSPLSADNWFDSFRIQKNTTGFKRRQFQGEPAASALRFTN
jgi:hypothetical protein